MNNKISGWSLYLDIYFGQFWFLNVLYRVIQTKLLQEPVLAQCGAGAGEGGQAFAGVAFWKIKLLYFDQIPRLLSNAPDRQESA